MYRHKQTKMKLKNIVIGGLICLAPSITFGQTKPYSKSYIQVVASAEARLTTVLTTVFTPDIKVSPAAILRIKLIRDDISGSLYTLLANGSVNVGGTLSKVLGEGFGVSMVGNHNPATGDSSIGVGVSKDGLGLSGVYDGDRVAPVVTMTIPVAQMNILRKCKK